MIFNINNLGMSNDTDNPNPEDMQIEHPNKSPGVIFIDNE